MFIGHGKKGIYLVGSMSPFQRLLLFFPSRSNRHNFALSSHNGEREGLALPRLRAQVRD
jgi:hypothetical protein